MHSGLTAEHACNSQQRGGSMGVFHREQRPMPPLPMTLISVVAEGSGLNA